MSKRKLAHVWQYLRHVHPWYFLLLTVIFGGLTVLGLRQNNERMITVREAVFVADKQGGDVESSLRELRQYVSTHMNTNLTSGTNAVHPPIQLKYTYERIQANRQQALGQNNSALYGQAQETCNQEGQTTTPEATITCIQRFMSDHGVQLEDVPDALYKFDFASARWSPDLAGWSIVFVTLSAASFIMSATYHWFMKRYS